MAKDAGSLSAVLISIHRHEGSWLVLSTADCMQFSLLPLWAPNAMKGKRSGADFPSPYCPLDVNVNVCHGPRVQRFSFTAYSACHTLLFADQLLQDNNAHNAACFPSPTPVSSSPTPRPLCDFPLLCIFQMQAGFL